MAASSSGMQPFFLWNRKCRFHEPSDRQSSDRQSSDRQRRDPYTPGQRLYARWMHRYRMLRFHLLLQKALDLSGFIRTVEAFKHMLHIRFRHTDPAVLYLKVRARPSVSPAERDDHRRPWYIWRHCRSGSGPTASEAWDRR